MPRWVVGAASAGMRLDRFITSQLAPGAVTNGLLQRLVRRRQMLWVRRPDGSLVSARDGGHRLDAGDVVELHDDVLNVSARDLAAPKTVAPLSLEEIAFARSLVLYKDPLVIAVNKPHGLASQGGSKVRNHMDRLLPAFVSEGEERPRLVHRLDKDTSGVLLLGRTREGAARLSEMFRTPGLVSKEYLAFLSRGLRNASGTIDAPLTQEVSDNDDHERTAVAREHIHIDPKLDIEREPLPKIVSAVTHYTVLHDLKANGAVVRLVPETGRKHQLRVHCASLLNAPIIGDGKYGKRGTPDGLRSILGDGPQPLHLHMHRVVLRDWNGAGRDLSVEAPLPPHMANTLQKLGIRTK